MSQVGIHPDKTLDVAWMKHSKNQLTIVFLHWGVMALTYILSWRTLSWRWVSHFLHLSYPRNATYQAMWWQRANGEGQFLIALSQGLNPRPIAREAPRTHSSIPPVTVRVNPGQLGSAGVSSVHVVPERSNTKRDMKYWSGGLWVGTSFQQTHHATYKVILSMLGRGENAFYSYGNITSQCQSTGLSIGYLRKFIFIF